VWIRGQWIGIALAATSRNSLEFVFTLSVKYETRSSIESVEEGCHMPEEQEKV
jgi:hypothetical protein